MNQWDYFLFLLNLLYQLDWMMIPLFVLFILAVIKDYLIGKTPFQAVHLLALVPFLFPILMLIWGTVFQHTIPTPGSDYTAAPAWLSLALWTLVVIQLLMVLGGLVYFK